MQNEKPEPQPSMDDVLKRMLSTPPKQHKDEKVGARKPSPEAVDIAARALARKPARKAAK